jgi:hypothetical protein
VVVASNDFGLEAVSLALLDLPSFYPSHPCSFTLKWTTDLSRSFSDSLPVQAALSAQSKVISLSMLLLSFAYASIRPRCRGAVAWQTDLEKTDSLVSAQAVA